MEQRGVKNRDIANVLITRNQEKNYEALKKAQQGVRQRANKVISIKVIEMRD